MSGSKAGQPRGDWAFQLTFRNDELGLKAAMHSRADTLGISACVYMKQLLRANLKVAGVDWQNDREPIPPTPREVTIKNYTTVQLAALERVMRKQLLLAERKKKLMATKRVRKPRAKEVTK